MIDKLNFIFVTFFGIGKIKKIPGTLASLFTMLLLFFLFHILNFSPNIILVIIILIFFISLFAVKIYIKDLSNKDPKEVVIDEVIVLDSNPPVQDSARETLNLFFFNNRTNF